MSLSHAMSAHTHQTQTHTQTQNTYTQHIHACTHKNAHIADTHAFHSHKVFCATGRAASVGSLAPSVGSLAPSVGSLAPSVGSLGPLLPRATQETKHLGEREREGG